ncbi:MAG: GIY-YIG nuclease family protein [Candidatus Bathyarchaeota archaeon]|nr:GIY-YIG nuclease family protein [Candidatus Bathyarchaeota archaeon]
MPVETRVAVGSLGTRRFQRGYYVYTGSALGKGALSLGGRVRRHLRKTNKKKRWHIDYLLSGSNLKIRAAITAHTNRKAECEINGYLRDQLQASIPVDGFGSSDCKAGCRSHLLYLGMDEDAVKKVAELYPRKMGSEIYVFDFR